jgi:hypothetical protein
VRKHFYGGQLTEHESAAPCVVDAQRVCDYKFSSPQRELVGTVYEWTESEAERAARSARLQRGE